MPARRQLPCKELSVRYANGESTIALARRYHCSPTTIAAVLRRCGAVLRRARFRSTLVPEDMLRELYLHQRLHIGQIAAHFGVSPSTIGNKRRAYGIAKRPRSM